MNTPRSPKECVEAVLANLEWNRQIHAKHGDDATPGSEEWAMESALERSVSSAINLIRTECASFLNPEHKDSSHA